jgi:hypothetical protein
MASQYPVKTNMEEIHLETNFLPLEFVKLLLLINVMIGVPIHLV